MMGANYKTKKDLKAAIGQPLRYVETSMFGAEYRDNGIMQLPERDSKGQLPAYAWPGGYPVLSPLTT